MTTSSQFAPQPPQSEDVDARTIVAAGGALGMVVLALIVYAVTDMVLPTSIIVLLIPIHVVLTMTDTNLLEDPKTAPFRAWGDLRRLVGSARATAPAPGAWQPPSAPATWSGPAGPAGPARPVPLGPGLSFDPPGPHGPSVIHGFGSYGGREAAPNPHEAPQPAPEAGIHRQQ